MRIKQTCVGILAAASLACVPQTAQSQAYPNKPVKVIIGFSAGSELDVIGRLVAQTMSESLGRAERACRGAGPGNQVGRRTHSARAPEAR